MPGTAGLWARCHSQSPSFSIILRLSVCLMCLASLPVHPPNQWISKGGIWVLAQERRVLKCCLISQISVHYRRMLLTLDFLLLRWGKPIGMPWRHAANSIIIANARRVGPVKINMNVCACVCTRQPCGWMCIHRLQWCLCVVWYPFDMIGRGNI